MAASAVSVLPGGCPPWLRRESRSPSGSLKSNRMPYKNWRMAVSVEEASRSTARGVLEKREEAEGMKMEGAAVKEGSEWWEEAEEEGKGWKAYLEESKEMIRPDGGPPRWFSPSVGAFRFNSSPLLLFLPGIDGVGLGLISSHKKLARIFDLWCLHIPVVDRTPFTELVKMVERTVRSENQRWPKRPIYLVGDSVGACLALAVVARNPDIDLVLILANPATSFGSSQLQLLTPLLEAMPSQLSPGLPYFLGLMAGDPLRMILDNALKGLSLENTARELTDDLSTLSSFLPVLADILPRETFQWKLEMLKSASVYANSRLHNVKAQTLILCSGRDQLLPSQQEGERLRRLLPNCELRKFDDSGHFLFLDDNIDLLTIIKKTSYYRRGKCHDYASDFVPPTRKEIEKVLEENRLLISATSAVMLSTLDDGTIVKGLAGVPSEGPVLFVGYHMLLGLEIAPLVSRFLHEKNILLRGLAHPVLFARPENEKFPDPSEFDKFRLMGAVPVAASNFFKLFASKSHILLYPGGMREALHRKGEEYKLFWPEQAEFVRMAARFGAKIVPFGAVGEDDLAQVVFDYEDLMKIPYFRSDIETLTEQAAKLRTDASGEVANQQMHLPGLMPKFPGRFYYYFGKAIETEGRRHELRDRDKSQELYLQVKSEVERCIAYLKEKRETDPYRNIVPRLLYQATHGFTSEVPTFEI
ncbi:phytyl ester synthase 2, chloroplastic-like [Prosopis cineraria]|uniref:phytyl ester synthase 2, chloroplastic-like n=1 Tax=Prosopis cineraria TaxID=364024 RepID=UPI00240FD3D0|nr:phytyl ester synthase 2, chloroplastic-like [Prosopis cineraria]